MPRPLTPEGRNVTVSAKVTALEAAAIDAARGEMTVSAWLQSVIAAALAPPVRPAASVARAPWATGATARTRADMPAAR